MLSRYSRLKYDFLLILDGISQHYDFNDLGSKWLSTTDYSFVSQVIAVLVSTTQSITAGTLTLTDAVYTAGMFPVS